MIYKNNIILTILVLINRLVADSGYNTIYLMEFENVDNNFTIVKAGIQIERPQEG